MMEIYILYDDAISDTTNLASSRLIDFNDCDLKSIVCRE